MNIEGVHAFAIATGSLLLWETDEDGKRRLNKYTYICFVFKIIRMVRILSSLLDTPCRFFTLQNWIVFGMILKISLQILWNMH